MEDKINVGILTVSDTCSQGKAEDTSGDNLEQIINHVPGRNMFVIVRKCVPDDCEMIKETLIEWCNDRAVNVILTTGGTGFGHRDVTPEATRLVIEKEAPGFTTAMFIEGLKKTEFAMLSRAVCGVKKNTLIINLPGSKKGSEENLRAVMNCIPHVVSLLKNKTEDIKMEHSIIQKAVGDNSHVIKQQSHHHHHHHHHPNNHGDHKSQVDISRVARRSREQVGFPMILLDDAIDIVINNALRTEIEKVDLRDEESRLKVVGHILAANVYSVEPFPPFPASIKDGYAVRASDGDGPRKVVGLRVAGSSPDLQTEGERICVRVNTGAPVPKGMDAVVQVEDTKLIEEADDGRTEVAINVLTKPVCGQDIRPVGSDISKDDLVIETNTPVTSTSLGLLATLGINEIQVFKFPRVGVLSTGDELIDPWNKDGPKPGCIRDSNKITLIRLLEENGFNAVDCGIARDSPDDVFEKMSSALKNVDVLITSGSVSMGEKDVIKSVLRTDLKAEIHFGRVNMKPGKPMTFATCYGSDGKKKLVFALPGNPSSAVLTCHVFVLPTLRKITGRLKFHNEMVVVKLHQSVHLDSRPELMRAILYYRPKRNNSGRQGSVCSLPEQSDNDYEIIASTTGNQISSRLASFKHVNGLLCLPPRSSELTSLKEGSYVNAYVIGKMHY